MANTDKINNETPDWSLWGTSEEYWKWYDEHHQINDNTELNAQSYDSGYVNDYHF